MYVVVRKNDTVIVDIFKHKIDNTYSFINLTKKHICPCKFNTKEEALLDLYEYKAKGVIKEYFELNL
ncbi:hypothetical protein [Clostridium perfringens]|uniref:hypothetical protein n=1 Tax=Clostridium perfringens TaxID=1502 RepID=UPI00096ABD2A|nr:hypothetical protein [Clostridium perfringens]